MWFTKESDGFRGWFHVEANTGLLRTGLVSGDFTATIVNPADSAINSPSVSESAVKPGLYNFLIPSSFLTSNGIGDYGVIIQVDTFSGPSGAPNVRGALSHVLSVSVNDFDDIASQSDINTLIEAIISDDLTVAAGSTTTEVRTNASQADGYFDGMILVVVDSSGTVNRGIGRNISAYSSVNGAFTLDTALPFTPAAGDRAIVLAHNELVGQIFVNSILIPAAL